MYQYCMNITVLFTSKDFVSQNPRVVTSLSAQSLQKASLTNS